MDFAFVSEPQKPLPSIFNEQLSQDSSMAAHLINSHLLNTNFYPMLDLATVEIPKGEETFPMSIPFFGINLKPLDFETLSRPSANADHEDRSAAPTEDQNVEGNDDEEVAVQDFPVLHDFHIQHRDHDGHEEDGDEGEEFEGRELLPEPRLPQSEVTSTRTHLDSRLHGVNHNGLDLSDFPLLDNNFSKLEKLEEIRFESVPKSPASLQASSSVTDSSGKSPLRRQVFNPTVKRVVMTHDDMMSTLKHMMENQEMDIQLEKKFLEALVDNEEN